MEKEMDIMEASVSILGSLSENAKHFKLISSMF